MKIVDLSMSISNNLITQRVFSGNVNVRIMTHEESKKFNSGIIGDQFTSAWNYISMTEHTGTHVDAFFHMCPDGETIDEMPLDFFYGKAVCLDMRHIPERGIISVDQVEEAEKRAGIMIDGHIVLFASGLHKKYYPSEKVLTMGHEISAEVVKWLKNRNSRMHGVEGPSTDILDKNTFPSHRACRDLKISHFEWLVNLEKLIGVGEFMFYGIPLKISKGSGSPVRAFAIINDY